MFNDGEQKFYWPNEDSVYAEKSRPITSYSFNILKISSPYNASFFPRSHAVDLIYLHKNIIVNSVLCESVAPAPFGVFEYPTEETRADSSTFFTSYPFRHTAPARA